MTHSLIPTSADYCALPGNAEGTLLLLWNSILKNVLHVQGVTPIASLTANTVRATSYVHVIQALPH